MNFHTGDFSLNDASWSEVESDQKEAIVWEWSMIYNKEDS